MENTAIDWLNGFEKALVEKDEQAFCRLFRPDGWFRDSLVFDWDIRSLEGPSKISAYLQERLPSSLFIPGSFHLDHTSGLEPKPFLLSAGYEGIEFAILFETPAILGRGYIRLQEEAKG